MIVEWISSWYELDQCIVVGDVDLFYLSNENCFADDFNRDADEVRAEILTINHKQLGRIKGIITIGLDYTIYLEDGRVLSVNAEEDPGKIYNDSINIEEWRFDVEVNIVERTGITLGERVQMMSSTERKALHNQLIEKYKRLLDISYAEWDIKQ